MNKALLFYCTKTYLYKQALMTAETLIYFCLYIIIIATNTFFSRGLIRFLENIIWRRNNPDNSVYRVLKKVSNNKKTAVGIIPTAGYR